MKPVLFFDVDTNFKNFIETTPTCSFQNILFTESLNQIENEKLKPFSEAEIISLFVHSEAVDIEKLNQFKNLKLIATRSTGFNHIDLDYCRKRGITVCNVPRYGEATVAEFAFGLLLALSRNIIRGRNALTHNQVDLSKYVGFDLQGKTIGIIGTGSIGKHAIQIARGFGMNVLAFDKYPSPDLKNAYVSDISEIYQKSDIISLHIPSTPENFHLLDATAFKQMKKGVIIINTARGDLIDTQALYQALREGVVGGAGLDVLENEDFLIHDEIELEKHTDDFDFLLDSAMNLKLLQFKNVIITPHIAFNSVDAIKRINQTTLDNINAFLNNEPINMVY